MIYFKIKITYITCANYKIYIYKKLRDIKINKPERHKLNINKANKRYENIYKFNRTKCKTCGKTRINHLNTGCCKKCYEQENVNGGTGNKIMVN